MIIFVLLHSEDNQDEDPRNYFRRCRRVVVVGVGRRRSGRRLVDDDSDADEMSTQAGVHQGSGCE